MHISRAMLNRSKPEWRKRTSNFLNTTLEVQRGWEDGDLVAIHSRVSHGPDQPDLSVVHMFRFEDDKIAELWDVGMEAPKDSPNKNGLF